MNKAEWFNFPAVSKSTAEQMRRSSLVREHLVKNLSMEEGFDPAPLLGMRGGKSKAMKVFRDFPQLITELNEAVVA